MLNSILSLDISASSTGWCYTDTGASFISGTIKSNPKDSRGTRLVNFGSELENLLLKLTPTYIVQEDTFSGKNVRTLKILSEFSGVSKYICMKTLNIDPFIVANTSVKSYFKSATKDILFDFICELFDLVDTSFALNNDAVDAQAQLLYYADEILNLYKYRYDKDYGYLYLEDTSE